MDEKEKREEHKDLLSQFNWADFRQDRFTYNWQFYSEEQDHYFEYVDTYLYEEGAIFEGEERVECKEVVLYRGPEKPPYDFYIRHSNWQLSLRVQFFKEVFNERAFIEGYQPRHKFERIVIPPTIYLEILNFINDFSLLQIRDLILELIASAQEIYIQDVAFWEKPENQKLITTAKKETEKAIQVIEQSGVDWKSRRQFKNGIRHHLDHIKFVFNTGTIKLEHNWLAREFIENMKRSYDDLHFKNWKKDLRRYPDRFEENAHKSKFKYRLANSYYNLLTKAKFFKVSPNALYPNQLMLCIAKLIEFSLIPIGNWDDAEDVKIKHIRNWLKRNDLEPKPTSVEIPTDIETLKKYFDQNFIEMANTTKSANAISIANFICNRFDIPYLLPALSHIASCIKETNWFLGHQMTSNNHINEPDIPEMNAFRKLMNDVKGKQKLAAIKFSFVDDHKEYKLSQRLPLYLVEEALRDYYEGNQVEFDNDTIPTSYEKNEDGSIKIDKEPRFSLPHERHLIRLVHSLYNFLKDTSGIEEGEIMPGERYYEIIALLFKESWVFYHKMLDDRYVVQKIKQWHKLDKES